MSFLFGSAPKATFSTQPTILPSQNDLINTLVSNLTAPGPTAQAGFPLGTSSLQALEDQALNIAAGPTQQQTSATDSGFSALQRLLGFQPPTATAPSATAPTISSADATKAFQTGVVQPLTDDFLNKTLPGITGSYGGSAGGAYSSGREQAATKAATDLERTLSQTGAQYSYDVSKLNQGAQLQTNQLNVGSDLSTRLANLQAAFSGAGVNLGALGQLNPTLQSSAAPLAADIGLSSAAFDPYQKMLADLIAGGTGSTVQTSGVGSGGSTGLLGGLLGGLGSFLTPGASGVSAIGNLFSDERLKDDITQIGEVDGFPLYRFKYKGDSTPRIGMMAQEVEKKLPSAVGRVGKFKTVDYGQVIAHLLEAA